MAAATAATSTIAFYGKGFTRGPEDHSDGRNFDDWRSRPGRLSHGLERETIATRSPCKAICTTKSPAKACRRPPATRRRIRRSSTPTRALRAGTSWRRWKRTVSQGNDIQVQVYYDRTNREEPEFRRDSQYLRHRFSAASSDCRGGRRFPGDWARVCSQADDIEVVVRASVSARPSGRIIWTPALSRMRSAWWTSACR